MKNQIKLLSLLLSLLLLLLTSCNTIKQSSTYGYKIKVKQYSNILDKKEYYVESLLLFNGEVIKSTYNYCKKSELDSIKNIQYLKLK